MLIYTDIGFAAMTPSRSSWVSLLPAAPARTKRSVTEATNKILNLIVLPKCAVVVNCFNQNECKYPISPLTYKTCN
jgi:hypothetical protein